MKNKFDLETSWIWLCAWLWYTVCIPFEYSKRKIRRKSDKFSISYKRHKYALIQSKKAYYYFVVDMPTLVLEDLKRNPSKTSLLFSDDVKWNFESEDWCKPWHSDITPARERRITKIKPRNDATTGMEKENVN